jgi:hypothetical protein
MAFNRDSNGKPIVRDSHGSYGLTAVGAGAAYVGTAAHPLGDRINAIHERHYDKKITTASKPYGFTRAGMPAADPRDKMPKGATNNYVATKPSPHKTPYQGQKSGGNGPKKDYVHPAGGRQGARDRRNGGVPPGNQTQYTSLEHKAKVKAHAQELVQNKERVVSNLKVKQAKKIIGETGKGRLRGAGAAVAVPALWYGIRSSAQPNKAPVEKLDTVTHHDADVGIAGGAATGAGYHMAGNIKHWDKKAKTKIEADPKLKARLKDYRENSPKHQLPKNAEIGDQRYRKFFRNMPTDLPGAKMKRTLSWTHTGTTGSLATGAVGVAGGLATIGAAQKHQQRKATKAWARESAVPLEKALFVQQRQHTGRRILTAGAGLGLVGFGLGRSPMLGRALGLGLKRATSKDARTTADAIRLAQSAYGALARGTARGERQMRQVRAVNAAVNKVPAAIRPAVATTTGMLLLGHARNQGRSGYSPVNLKINIHPGVNQ